MRVSEAIARALAREAPAAPIFALTGDANLKLAGEIDRLGELPLYFARHEAAAVAMADGYAQATGRVGIATVTCGPGLTHAATSVVAAGRMRTPLVVIAGDTPTEDARGLHGMQDFDQLRFAEACETPVRRMAAAGEAGEVLREAFADARSRRRPVLVDVPVDVQDEELDDDWEHEPARIDIRAQRPSDAEVRRAVDALAGCTRPLVLAGRGAAHARADVAVVAEKLGALLGTTLLAKGLFDGNEWNLGIVGGYSSEAALRLLADVDAVLAFGASLGSFTTREGELLRGRRVVHVDLEAPPPNDGRVVVRADAREAARMLVDALNGGSGLRTDATRAILAAAPSARPAPADGLLDPHRLMDDLNAAIPRDARVVVGGGHFWRVPCMELAVPAAGDMLFPLGFAAVGQALPFGIGVAAADPNRPVVVVEGDGSLLMNVAELETAARYRLPLTLVVMNDGALTAEVVRLRAAGYSERLATYPPVDFTAVARAFGWSGATPRDHAEAAEACAGMGAAGMPYLVDARILPDPV